MKIYEAPFNYPRMGQGKDRITKNNLAIREWVLKISKRARKEGSGKLAGGVIQFHVGDGDATYIIFDDRTLWHVPETYHQQYVNRMTRKDIEWEIQTCRYNEKVGGHPQKLHEDFNAQFEAPKTVKSKTRRKQNVA